MRAPEAEDALPQKRAPEADAVHRTKGRVALTMAHRQRGIVQHDHMSLQPLRDLPLMSGTGASSIPELDPPAGAGLAHDSAQPLLLWRRGGTGCAPLKPKL